jgi:SAM-dependent methyltransferase
LQNVIGILRTRRLVPEIMDDPSLEVERLHGALHGIRRINFVSRSASTLWSPIRELAQCTGLRTLGVFDVGSGLGDVLCGLWRLARRGGVALDIEGSDCSPRAVRFAAQFAAARRAPLRFRRLDAVREPLPEADVVTCSLFLHHLNDDDALQVLRSMRASAGKLVLVNDLRRCAWGMGLAHAVTPFLTRSPVVHTDSVRSVNAAFTVRELAELARRAGMAGATVSSRFPARLLLEWRRPG